MKLYISRFLRIIAGLFLVFPLIYIVGVAILFDIPFQKCAGILLSPSYYIVAFSVASAGYGIREARRWSWYMFIFSQILLAAENALLVHGYAESHYKILAYVLSLLVQVLLIYEVDRQLRVPYFFPRIRWWESNPRYRLSMPAILLDKAGKRFEAEILDLSVLGCFARSRVEIPQDAQLTIQLRSFNHDLSIDGVAVWLAHSAVTHPKGVGIKFLPIPKNQRRSLRHISRKLRKINILYRRYRYLLSQDEFLKRLNEIEQGTSRNPSLFRG